MPLKTPNSTPPQFFEPLQILRPTGFAHPRPWLGHCLTHLHRLTFGRQSGEAYDVGEVYCNGVELDRLDGLSTHQLLRYRPAIKQSPQHTAPPDIGDRCLTKQERPGVADKPARRLRNDCTVYVR